VSWRAYIEGTLTDLVVGRMFFCPAAPFFRNQLLSYENIRLTELLSSCSRACPFLSLETTPRLLVSSYPPNTHTFNPRCFRSNQSTRCSRWTWRLRHMSSPETVPSPLIMAEPHALLPPAKLPRSGQGAAPRPPIPGEPLHPAANTGGRQGAVGACRSVGRWGVA
jgi:hypothetical protein